MEIKEAIEESKVTIKKYEETLVEQQVKMAEKVHHILKDKHKVVEPVEVPKSEPVEKETVSEESVPNKVRIAYKNKPDQTEYKYAFGQKIQKDYEWKVRQPTKEEKDKSA